MISDTYDPSIVVRGDLYMSGECWSSGKPYHVHATLSIGYFYAVKMKLTHFPMGAETQYNVKYAFSFQFTGNPCYLVTLMSYCAYLD